MTADEVQERAESLSEELHIASLHIVRDQPDVAVFVAYAMLTSAYAALLVEHGGSKQRIVAMATEIIWAGTDDNRPTTN